jgi:hypothetical protein
LTQPWQSCRAAFFLAVKYSDSWREYMSRAASQAIWRRNFEFCIKLRRKPK